MKSVLIFQMVFFLAFGWSAGVGFDSYIREKQSQAEFNFLISLPLKALIEVPITIHPSDV